MANVYFAYPCAFILYNMNGNNNDKTSNTYPLVLTDTQSSTVASISHSSVQKTVDENKSEPNIRQASPVVGDPHLECDQEVDGESELQDKAQTTVSEEIMAESDKPITRGRRRKIMLETDTTTTSPIIDDAESVPKPKPRGRRGRKKKGSVVETPKKAQGPKGPKTCANCGTVADKAKAKKCHKCQMFFFDHWARRCRIPPCPNCHYHRKSRGGEAVPQFCERCGHALKGDVDNLQHSVGETSSLLVEVDSASDTSSFQPPEDFRDMDYLSHSRDSDNEDEESVHESVGSDPSATEMGKTDTSGLQQSLEMAHGRTGESLGLTDEVQDSTKKPHDVTDWVPDADSSDVNERSHQSTKRMDTCGESNNANSIPDEITSPTLPIDSAPAIGKAGADSSDVSIPNSSDTAESRLPSHESNDSVDQNDTKSISDINVTESISTTVTEAASHTTTERDAPSQPSHNSKVDPSDNEVKDTAPTSMFSVNESTKEARRSEPSESQQEHPGLLQPASSQELPKIVPTVPTRISEAKTSDKENLQTQAEEITDDTKQEASSNYGSLPFAESGVGTNDKKSSNKSTEKLPKNRGNKRESIENKEDVVPVSTAEEVLGPHSHGQSVVSTSVQQSTPTVKPANPVPMISAHEVEALRSVQGSSGLQSEPNMAQLLHQAQSLGTPMTSSLAVHPLLKNIFENLKQQQLHVQEENRSNVHVVELLNQRLQPRAEETNLQGAAGQQQLINQQIKLTQQLINQLQNKFTQQRSLQMATMLQDQDIGSPCSSSSSASSSCIHLPQKRLLPETGSEDSELMPSSSKKPNILPQGDAAIKITTPRIIPLGTYLPVPVNTSIASCPSIVTEQVERTEASDIPKTVSQRHVTQSSSKVIPRSASLPPQLVPSSSLMKQENDDDTTLSAFPLSSTPCLSHTLPPPPLKPTPSTKANDTAVTLQTVSSSERILPPSLPAPPPNLVPSSALVLPLSVENLPSQQKCGSANSIEESGSLISGSDTSVVSRSGPVNVLAAGETVSSGSGHTAGSEHLLPVKLGSQSLSVPPSPASGSFHKLEVGSPPPISGQSNKIRVSLLKSREDQQQESVTASPSNAQSPLDEATRHTVGSPALTGKFQNFALAPNLSVIATVETQSKAQSSTAHSAQLSPSDGENSADSRPLQLKSDSLQLQRSLEDCPNPGIGSSRQCTPEEIEEISNIQKRISSALAGTTSIGSPTSLSQPQLPPQPQHLAVPSLLSPIPSVPVPGRGAVSITVIKSTTQSELDCSSSNVSIQTTATDKGPAPLTSSNLPSVVSGSSSSLGVKMPAFVPPASLTQNKSSLQPPLNKDVAGLPCVGVQAAPCSTLRKLAPRKPGPSGIVTIQVCNTIPNSSAVTAAKMTSQSVGVGTEPSASQAAGVHMTPSIVQPRPSAQIGGVLVTPQPSIGHTSMNHHMSSNTPSLLKKTPSMGRVNSEPHTFPGSPPNRSVYVTKLYSNLPPSSVQTSKQSYNPHSRSGLKELSSPAFEEALISAARLHTKPVQDEEEEKEKPAKKEKKKGGKLKTKEKEGGKGSVKGKKCKGKLQGDKGEKFQADKALARLMSEEILDSESDQTSETGSQNGDKKKSSDSGGHGGKSDGEVSKEASNHGEEDENEENKDEKGGNGDKLSKKYKNGKTSGKKDDMKLLLYSVKLKDCFLHHMLWQDYRVVLLVPLDASGSVKCDSPGSKVKVEETEATPPPERKRRRKSKIEPLDIHDMEAEMDPLVESPATSSAHIHSPCFSVYELRNKLFSESNAVYAYTYKNQIKTLKPPLHWVHVLKRMGGMQENCHTCRLLDVGNVKGMSQHYGNSSSLPSSLDNLCRNDLPKGRKVIDLSSLDPEDLLESGQIEEIPQCSFIENPSSKKKGPGNNSSRKRQKKQLTQTSAKRPHKEPEHEKTEDMLDQSTDLNQSLDLASSQSDQGEDEVEDSHDPHDPADDDDDEERLVIAQQTDEESITSTSRPNQRSPPPLIKQSSLTSQDVCLTCSGTSKNPQKKKFCPDCGTPIARKCKKCPTCGKRFGIFTFGRKLCPGCGRVNLARMTACYECGHSMQFAQKALPKGICDDLDMEAKCTSHSQSVSYMFGSRKRRRIPGLSYSSDYGFSPDASKELKLSMPDESSSCLPSTGDASEFYDGDGIYSEGRLRDAEDIAIYDTPTVQSGKKSKHLGYQYGRVPWGDADITCLVDENGTPKFCLQELCSKVLRNQVKADVFDMVKNLNLPVLQGDTALLKKLQALGLHSNRSPICRLIAAEELWTLLDALQEPVPEEVHQHLENISSSTTPLMQSPSHLTDGSSGPVLQSPGLVAGGSALIDEDEHGFESTLHEMECSDGQYISILRTWNGEQYACLTEVWRKYFPEVNRNHLTSALKRLGLDTHMPTGQQATLLRSAGVISVRGAAGRLMRLEDTQMLLDDFGIPLQISSSSDSKEKSDVQAAPPSLPPVRLNPGTFVQPISRRKMSAPGYFANNMVSSVVKQEPKEDSIHAQCMRNILTAINYDDLVKLLEKSRDDALSHSANVDEDATAVTAELDGVQQLIHSRRELCNVLSSEIGYLTASNHAYMAEVVRLNHTGKQILQDLDSSLLAFDIRL